MRVSAGRSTDRDERPAIRVVHGILLDPLLEPLRHRDDFARLLRELESGRDRYLRICRELPAPARP
jgi:hypothetical protein